MPLPRWIVETPTDLWLVAAANAADACAQVRQLTADAATTVHAAPLPRLSGGKPRRVLWRDDRWDADAAADADADDTVLEPTVLSVPLPPLQQVLSITYYDADGNRRVMDLQ